MNHAVYNLCVASVGIAVAVAGPASAELTAPGAEENQAKFFERLKELEATRQGLYEALKMSSGQAQKDRVREAARKVLIRTVVEEIIPFWIGLPWTMAIIADGLKPDAAHPFEKGKGISCSWFVVSVLKNAGVRFFNPRDFAGALSIDIQYSFSPERRDIHRFFNVTPKQLEQKLRRLGDGLYLMGLNCHVGFVYVNGDRVDFLHASYTGPRKVVVEPVAAAEAVAFSEKVGYVVSPLFQDRRLIDRWLAATPVPFQKRSKV